MGRTLAIRLADAKWTAKIKPVKKYLMAKPMVKSLTLLSGGPSIGLRHMNMVGLFGTTGCPATDGPLPTFVSTAGMLKERSPVFRATLGLAPMMGSGDTWHDLHRSRIQFSRGTQFSCLLRWGKGEEGKLVKVDQHMITWIFPAFNEALESMTVCTWENARQKSPF
ncbi:hypothetical protein ACLOJK_011678 [Asimina triloba]